MLSGGELVGVWPEGFKGIGKPFSERYKLQRFGRGGFVSAALRTGVPIVPLSVVGAEEIYPLVGNIPVAGAAARACPTSRSRRSSRCSVRSAWCRCRPSGCSSSASRSAPTPTTPVEADDPMLVFNVTDQVRETIQQTLYTLLRERAERLPLTRADAGQGSSESVVPSSVPWTPSTVPSRVVPTPVSDLVGDRQPVDRPSTGRRSAAW